jgi:hypothetical protein
VAQRGSDLSHEYKLIDELRTTFEISDERLVAVGYAKQLKLAIPEPPLTWEQSYG